jgi:hypothetical protein
MQQVMGILILIVVCVGFYYVRKGIGRGITAIDGAFSGNTRKRGLAAVHLRTNFSAPVPAKQVIDRVIETLELDRPNIDSLEIGGRADDGSAIRIMSKTLLHVHLDFVLDADDTATGCTGYGATARWLESEGQITTTEKIERIHKHVRAAVEHFGGTFVEATQA